MPDRPAAGQRAAAVAEEAVGLGGGVRVDDVEHGGCGEARGAVAGEVELPVPGLPGLEEVRSKSRFGLSQVVVTFEDATDIYLARYLIMERLAAVELASRRSGRDRARIRGLSRPGREG